MPGAECKSGISLRPGGKNAVFTRQENEGESLYVLSGKQAGNERTERLLDSEFLFLIHEEDGILTYKASGEAGEEIRIASSEPMRR